MTGRGRGARYRGGGTLCVSMVRFLVMSVKVQPGVYFDQQFNVTNIQVNANLT